MTSMGTAGTKPSPVVFPCTGMQAPPIVNDHRLPALLMIYISTKVTRKKNIYMSNPLDLISSEMLRHSCAKFLCPFELLTISRMPLKSGTGFGRVENLRKFVSKILRGDEFLLGKDVLSCRWPMTQNTSENRTFFLSTC